MSYKYHTPAEYDQIIRETEAQIEERSRLEQVRQWIEDPRNAAQLAHIRAEFDRVVPQRQPQQGPAAQPAQPGKLPAVINGNARFHPNHLRMKPATSQLDSVGDNYVFSPGSTVRQR